MSLSTRVIAALGAVVVIGAGTIGGSIAYASGQPTPTKTQATVTVGRSSHALDPNPTCFNGGKPLSDAARQACATLSNQAASTFPDKVSVKWSDQLGVGIDPDAAKNGWRAFTNGGGGQGGALVANFQKDTTFSGLQPAANLLTSSRDTALTVIEFDPKTAGSANPGIVAVWFVDLVNSAAPATSPQDAAGQGAGQGASQGQ
ncbi:hypothetical protein [Kitasatospora sp. GAS204B]|uniref:hypothetical protein n=1 Tax=unclassified Kitasatospora TaxID=2633591 RepID=UPI002474C798|nr:hypothetical protein [Kitasatospora sp. GAS204B]MDH6118179.1 hypothetical protein [Kitasatospora sp. GAS204B]